MLFDHRSGPSVEAAPARPAGVQLRPRRSPRLVALGVLLVVLGALGAAALYTAGNDRHDAIIMARDVARGRLITADDVTLVSVPADLDVDFTDGAKLGEVVGQRALTDLPAGAFPTTRHFGDAPIPRGTSLVGLQLGPGRMPGTQLEPGSPVQLVSLAEGDQDVVDAVVAKAPTLTDDGSGFVLDVLVADDVAHRIARLAAAGQIALIGVGEE